MVSKESLMTPRIRLVDQNALTARVSRDNQVPSLNIAIPKELVRSLMTSVNTPDKIEIDRQPSILSVQDRSKQNALIELSNIRDYEK